MNEDRFENLLKQASKRYNPPSETPREKIWARMQSERAQTDKALCGSSTLRGRLLGLFGRRPVPALWPIGVAALLVAGILIGRTLPISDEAEHTVTAAVEPAPETITGQVSSDDTEGPFLHAVAPYLDSVETLLTMIDKAGPGSDSGESISAWAEELLGETRLLKASVLRDDEELKPLFDDLELVLVRIVRLSEPESGEENRWTDESIHRRSILLKLREKNPSRPDRYGV